MAEVWVDGAVVVSGADASVVGTRVVAGEVEEGAATVAVGISAETDGDVGTDARGISDSVGVSERFVVAEG
ncbi:hypothetical protein [Mycobacterium camsae]|uniref:hypothetical protein n=1 Tax=Mycobacterium gordonae TaxID=1778 RepID=UPI0019811A65|nr:hypothetical protein [Mycobacterium gordonae]